MRYALTLVVLLIATPAWAWTVADVLSWGASPGAVSYRVEKTSDGGATWTTVGTPALPALTYNGTDAGLVLYRVSACTAVSGGGACTPRPEVGPWHNESWRPLPPVAGLATQ